MKQQLTTEAIVLLAAVLIVFWASIAALVRHHGSRHAGSRVSRRATETRG